MISIISICLFLFNESTTFLVSQSTTIEPAVIECRYLENVMVDTLSKRIVGDTLILKAGRMSSAFYSKDLFFRDSLTAQPGGKEKLRRLMLQYAREGRMSELTSNTSEYIYQNWPEGSITTRAKLEDLPVEFTEERELPEWTLMDSSKIILGYECQMAEADFRGRRWIAWYSTAVPISIGPWKLWGLPGLIFEAYDSKKEYSYSMTSISAEFPGEVVVFDWLGKGGKYTAITRKKYLRAYLGMESINAETAKESGLGDFVTERNYDLRERDY
ncbi:MAG: GLPGLI family protein [Bacteroidales bacterium]|nr:GLPGLI family protein [Bacteroidales bacterium]MDY6002465.1 GLPGLI family protein [Candidatus Cryptobacteroides sp.]